ncbi:AF4/FMR2 family member 1-like [Dunckerocampus dactyliophorus]|uniref:AF4/FMR2 family member 1-like n=1 Tax=Dunckerocampus dactyliophorus TaxID=161453 RepID=UPI0024058096|nr:AF4/FMR2 family member 1-like [Dunckerocampus dactyliophorus]
MIKEPLCVQECLCSLCQATPTRPLTQCPTIRANQWPLTPNFMAAKETLLKPPLQLPQTLSVCFEGQLSLRHGRRSGTATRQPHLGPDQAGRNQGHTTDGPPTTALTAPRQPQGRAHPLGERKQMQQLARTGRGKGNQPPRYSMGLGLQAAASLQPTPDLPGHSAWPARPRKTAPPKPEPKTNTHHGPITHPKRALTAPKMASPAPQSTHTTTAA